MVDSDAAAKSLTLGTKLSYAFPRLVVSLFGQHLASNVLIYASTQSNPHHNSMFTGISERLRVVTVHEPERWWRHGAGDAGDGGLRPEVRGPLRRDDGRLLLGQLHVQLRAPQAVHRAGRAAVGPRADRSLRCSLGALSRRHDRILRILLHVSIHAPVSAWNPSSLAQIFVAVSS